VGFIRVGLFEDFKGADTLLISLDHEGLESANRVASRDQVIRPENRDQQLPPVAEVIPLRQSASRHQLTQWPLLGAVQDAKHPNLALGLKDFVNCNEWERREAVSRVPCTRPLRPRCGNVFNVPMRSTTDCATRRADSGRLSAM
jgi:hypothetical protein